MAELKSIIIECANKIEDLCDIRRDVCGKISKINRYIETIDELYTLSQNIVLNENKDPKISDSLRKSITFFKSKIESSLYMSDYFFTYLIMDMFSNLLILSIKKIDNEMLFILSETEMINLNLLYKNNEDNNVIEVSYNLGQITGYVKKDSKNKYIKISCNYINDSSQECSYHILLENEYYVNNTIVSSLEKYILPSIFCNGNNTLYISLNPIDIIKKLTKNLKCEEDSILDDLSVFLNEEII